MVVQGISNIFFEATNWLFVWKREAFWNLGSQVYSYCRDSARYIPFWLGWSVLLQLDTVRTSRSINIGKTILKATSNLQSYNHTGSCFLSIRPAARSSTSICLILAETRRPTSPRLRWASIFSFVNLPCFRFAAEMRWRPSWVRAPVDRPPCRAHRPLCL